MPLFVKTYLDKSAIHGFGVFASENIKEGQLVWKFDPNFDRLIKEDDIKDPIFKNFAMFYGTYNANDRTRFVSIDDARYVNHSISPNTSGNEWGLIANKDIVIGEEITCNYFDACDEARNAGII